MKLINNIQVLLACTLALLLTACAKGELDALGSNHDKLATLTVDIVGGGLESRASNLSTLDEDYTIQTLRVFAVGESGVIEVNKYIDNVTASSSGLYYTFEVIKSDKKQLYVLVNEPSSLTETLNQARLQTDISLLNYEIAEALNNEQFVAGGTLGQTNRLIPMSATVEVDARNDSRITVEVDRVVARVDLMVDKDEVARTTNVEFNSSTSVSVNGLYYTTSLFPTEDLRTPTSAQLRSVDGVSLSKTTVLSLKTANRSSAARLLSFYMAERTYNIDNTNPSENRIAINIDNITVEGAIKNINSTILLGNNVQPYLEQINRNYVYRIFATYKGEEHTLEANDEYVIEDWTVEELDGDIEGVMLAVTNQVVMDWYRLDNSFTAKDVAFGSNRRIEILVPSTYDMATKQYTFSKCKFVSQQGASYDLLDLSQYGVSDADNYLRQVPWLTKAIVRFDSRQKGHFEFTYQLGSTPDHLDQVPLQIVSANVRKQLKIIYDNGYVPGDLLQANDIADCWGQAPNGIVFAKRGDALHPTITEQVLSLNSQGYYDGDVSSTADQADQYCKDKLGPKWYAPNKAQLADIQRHVLELGTSYRMNNAPDTYYWSSEEDTPGNYWSVNFTNGQTQVQTVSAPAATQYYIRCIANL